MLKEAIEKLESLVRQSARTKVVDAMSGFRNRALVDTQAGPVFYDDDFPRRNHTALSLESFKDYLAEGFGDGSIWHTENEVVAVLHDLDQGHRDDRIRLPLVDSEKWQKLAEAAQPRKQFEFVRFIEKNYRTEVDAANSGLLGRVRAVVWQSSNTASGEITQGRESMSRSALQQMRSGGDDFPETITLDVRRWAILDCTVKVNLQIVVDMAKETFALVPQSDELDRAKKAAQDWLHGELTVAELPVYHGTP